MKTAEEGKRIDKAIRFLQGGPKTAKQISWYMSCTDSAAHSLISRAIKQGRIRRIGEKNSRLYEYIPQNKRITQAPEQFRAWGFM